MVKQRDVSSEYFWTDATQANDRLAGTTILYDNEPFYVSEVRGGYSDGIPRAFLMDPSKLNDPAASATRKHLNSPLFKKFRELPPLGWVNPSQISKHMKKEQKPSAVFLQRTAMRNRQHGLSNDNVRVSWFQKTQEGGLSLVQGGGAYTYRLVAADNGYRDACKLTFPTLKEVLAHIEENSCVAFSPKYAVFRDAIGFRWLYREDEKIGIFSGADTLNLSAKKAYCREEIMDDPNFTINTIREF